MKNTNQSINRISFKRIAYIIFIIIIFVIGETGLSIYNKLSFDEIYGIVVISIIFLLIISVSLMHNRINDGLNNSATNYGRLTLRVLLSWFVMGVSLFLPEFFSPVMLIVIILSSCLNEALCIEFSLFYIIIFNFASGLSANVLYCYIILALIASIICNYAKKTSGIYRIDLFTILLCANVIIPAVFYYLSYSEVNIKIFVYGIILGMVICAFYGFFFRLLLNKSVKERTEAYSRLLADDYELIKDIKSFSMAEYNHALKVSRMSNKCARAVGADENVATVAGFYYRLGKMEGEPEIDNAIKVANAHSFPKDVIMILSEYAGIMKAPSTLESAIVHMVDAVVTKIELLDADKMTSAWNQDMVIYQTLNELSNSGIYDDSSISMNQFLKIRELLVKEDTFI